MLESTSQQRGMRFSSYKSIDAYVPVKSKLKHPPGHARDGGNLITLVFPGAGI